MGPVAGKGNQIADDASTVADALETFADAAQTARTDLRALKEEAITFSEAMRKEDDWSSDVENFAVNRRLILDVNRAWATFQEAERECANAIAAVTGSGNSYIAAGAGEPGPRDIVYGLNPGDIPDAEYDLTDFDDWRQVWNDSWLYLEHSEKPWPLDWATDAGAAVWDGYGPMNLWDFGVGAVTAAGLWREGKGWADNPREAWGNFVDHKREIGQGLGALGGIYDGQDWMNPFDSESWDQEKWESTRNEAWVALGLETREDLTAWSEWEGRPAYTVTTTAATVGTSFISMPARGGLFLGKLGNGDFLLGDRRGNGDAPTTFWGMGPAGQDGFSLSDWRGGRQESYSELTDRLNDRLEGLNADFGSRPGNTGNGSPDTPSNGGTGDTPQTGRSGPNETSDSPLGGTPKPQGTGADRPGDGDSPRRSEGDDRGDGSPRLRDDGQQDKGGSRGEEERPEPATGGGEGGGEQPPRDRTGTGDEEGDQGKDGDDATGNSEPEDPREPSKPAPPERVINDLRDFRSRVMTFGDSRFALDRGGMKHILVRHHPGYWDGSKKGDQSFFNEKMSIEVIADALEEVMRQNRDEISKRGSTGMYQISGQVNGENYRLGIKNGRIRQFFPVY